MRSSLLGGQRLGAHIQSGPRPTEARRQVGRRRPRPLVGVSRRYDGSLVGFRSSRLGGIDPLHAEGLRRTDAAPHHRRLRPQHDRLRPQHDRLRPFHQLGRPLPRRCLRRAQHGDPRRHPQAGLAGAHARPDCGSAHGFRQLVERAGRGADGHLGERARPGACRRRRRCCSSRQWPGAPRSRAGSTSAATWIAASRNRSDMSS
jgi:hypothetical protein